MAKTKGFMSAYNRVTNLMFDRDALALQTPETLKDALGPRGEPLSVPQAYTGANPYFDRRWEHKEYNENCQRCVVAYELRRRGYDVIAAPTFEGDLLAKVAYRQADGTTMDHWMGAFRGAKPIKVGTEDALSTKAAIDARMREFGSGSRAVLKVSWTTGYDHVLSVENVGGRIRYVDAQTGKSVHMTSRLALTFTDRTQLIRTDNLRISERARLSVMQNPRR